MSKYANENVLVIPRALFDKLGAFQGFTDSTETYLPNFLSPENNFFMLRDEAEEDPTHKQLIPYTIFHHEGKFLHYVRGNSSGEKRLTAKGSIGIGGHINTEDEQAASLEKDTYMTGVERETNEELTIDTTYTQHLVGLINDDSNSVGQVHLGIVHVFDLKAPHVQPNEAAITELSFLHKEELREKQSAMETWSQICVENLETILKTLSPASV